MKIKKIKEMKKKILTLTVSKQWFDMIVAGERRKQKKYVRKHPECVIWI